MKRIISLFLAVLFVALAVCSFSAVTIPKTQTFRSADADGAYVVSFSGSHADITQYASRTYSAGLDLSYRIIAVCAACGKVVLFCDDTVNSQLYVYVYCPEQDALDSFAVYDARIDSGTDFCCDANAIYLENYRNNPELTAYSYNGNLLNRYRFDEEITDVFSGYNGGVYAVGNNLLYRLASGGFTALSSGKVQPHLFPADDRVIVSDSGTVYVLDGNRISHNFRVDTDYSARSACVIGSRVYYPCGSFIYGYDIDTGDKLSSCRVASPDPLLYTDNHHILAVTESSCTALSENDFTELYRSDDAGSTGNTPSADLRSSVGGASAEPDFEIASEVYTVDTARHTIAGISPGTSVSAFRSDMKFSGYSLTLYRENTAKTSGNVGTAMTAVFTFGGESLTFELAVTGDLTGEGNRNSRDLNLLMDYLTGAADFNGVYALAADVSKDQTVDVVDLAILKSMIT